MVNVLLDGYLGLPTTRHKLLDNILLQAYKLTLPQELSPLAARLALVNLDTRALKCSKLRLPGHTHRAVLEGLF